MAHENHIIDLADELVTQINGNTFETAITATRHYIARVELKDADSIKCFVVPRSMTEELAGRKTLREVYEVDVAILKRFSTESNVNIDLMMELVQEVRDFLSFKKLTSVAGTVWAGSQVDPLWIPEHLENNRQFTSVIRVTYSRMRAE